MAKVPVTAIFPVPSNLISFAQDTVDRMAYLFPEISFSIIDAGIGCSSNTDLDRVMLHQEIRYNLARQKVRAEGHQNRAALYAALFR